METSFKALIAAACVAVIAVAGLTFTRDHQTVVAREAVAQSIYDRDECRRIVFSGKHPNMTQVRADCIRAGHIER